MTLVTFWACSLWFVFCGIVLVVQLSSWDFLHRQSCHLQRQTVFFPATRTSLGLTLAVLAGSVLSPTLPVMLAVSILPALRTLHSSLSSRRVLALAKSFFSVSRCPAASLRPATGVGCTVLTLHSVTRPRWETHGTKRHHRDCNRLRSCQNYMVAALF